MSQILIRNGIVYDPVTQSLHPGEIAVCDGVIAKKAGPDAYVVDADGAIVTTGLIDYHLHVFQKGTEAGVPAEMACFPNGVTTCMDGGSAGCGNYPSFYQQEIVPSSVTVRAMLNVASAGLIGGAPENLDPDCIEEERIKQLFRKHPELKALKLRASRGVMKDVRTLEKTVHLAEELGCNVVVHVTDPALPMEKIVSCLRAGDVFCHVYQGFGDTVLNADGTVKKAIREAGKRGVLFDACNGRNNFSLEVARQCVEERFLPDIISSDLNTCCYYKRPCVSLTRIMSKYLAFGVPVTEVLKCVTLNPAKALGEMELASLEPGSVADLCILKLEDCDKQVEDCHGNVCQLRQMIVPQMTIKHGEIVYSQNLFA